MYAQFAQLLAAIRIIDDHVLQAATLYFTNKRTNKHKWGKRLITVWAKI